MVKQFESLYKLLPEGYVRSCARNAISFLLHSIPFGTEQIVIDGVSFRAQKIPVYDNQHLALEVSGYNRFYKLKKGDIVVDGGGYSGFFTIYAGKKIGAKGKVITFEPDPFNFTILEKNIKRNNVKNVILINKGLHSKDEILPFDVQGIGSTFVIKKGRTTMHKLPVVSLDNELKRLGIKNVNFIKMDIEGGEIEAVKGCVKTITQNKNIHFAIASYHIVNGKQTSVFLENFFKKLKMKVTTIRGIHPTTYASKK